MSPHRDDPIVAIATPPGRGGVGVVRISFGVWSGTPDVAHFVAALCGRAAPLVARHATMVGVRDAHGATIDRGIALAFAAPHSYTAEDVLELQMHGGPVVLQMIVTRCLAVADAIVDKSTNVVGRLRLAEPGEFTERAFLNDRLDLAQAEAVADLIEAGSDAAVLGAQASLSGAFSIEVRTLVDRTIELRALVEATLDFPDEEIDFLEESDARGRLAGLSESLATLLRRARQGALLREGLTVVLVGRPNVGKSSLLNALAGADVAIVTPIAGTTRDRIERTIRLDGIALHVIDTAGIRELDDSSTADDVERIGIARAWEAVERAQVVLHVVEATDRAGSDDDEAIVRRLPSAAAHRVVVNKIDLSGESPRIEASGRVHLSAKSGAGVDGLRAELLGIAGWHPGGEETGFIARERHVTALREAGAHLDAAAGHAAAGDRRLDLLAEELRLAQQALDRITGAFNADDLLGEIFGRFCIGK